MKKQTLSLLIAILFFALAACVPNKTVQSSPPPTRRVISLEEELAAEEAAAEAVATAYAKKTQIASRVSPYVNLSDGKQSYLAFWFNWNDETVFLPLNEFIATDSGLATCRMEPEEEIIKGNLYLGWALADNECKIDVQSAENAPPVIKIPGYFDYGINTQELNIIDLNGEHAENLADILSIIVKNDLLGSGDLTISMHLTDGPDGEPFSEEIAFPSYMLSEEALRFSFSIDQMEELEYVEDVVYALEREFTWKIPKGFSDLNLSPGDENWFVLKIKEERAGNDLEDDYLNEAHIQVKGVGAPDN